MSQESYEGRLSSAEKFRAPLTSDTERTDDSEDLAVEHLLKPRETEFTALSQKIIDKGQNISRENHPEKRYHGGPELNHIHSLEGRSERMGEIFNLSPDQNELVKIAISTHDAIIDIKIPQDTKDVNQTVARRRGARSGDKPDGAQGNEARSAELAVELMKEANKKAGKDVFSPEHIATVTWAIEATYPDVILGKDFQGVEFKSLPHYSDALRNNPSLTPKFLEERGITKGVLFWQPHLENYLTGENGVEKKPVPKEVLTMALADLGASGSGSAEKFFKEGDDEFAELHINIQNRLPELLAGGPEFDDDRKRAAKKMLDWQESQPKFALGQMIRFEKLMQLLRNSEQPQLSEDEERGLRAMFSHFGENIQKTSDRFLQLRETHTKIATEQGEQAGFRFLAQAMHYPEAH